MQIPREMGELFQRDLLCADLRREVQAFELLGQALHRPVLLEQFEHHLASLREAAFHKLNEHPALIVRQRRQVAAHQADAG